MAADRPSRELRVVETDSGSLRVQPVTDPPKKPAKDSERPPRQPWGPASKVALIVALVGSGGLGALVQPALSWAGERAEQRRQVAALADRVSELTGAVNRLADSQVRTEKAVARIEGQLDPVANLRGSMAEADSYLAREPRPDVRAAREALALDPPAAER